MKELTFILELRRDLDNYSDKDLRSIADKYNFPKINIDDLKWMIAIQNQSNLLKAEMPIDIRRRGIVDVSHRCLSGYELKKLLGAGSFGSVYQACKELSDDCQYAVKLQSVYDPTGEQSREQLTRNFNEELVNTRYFYEKLGVGPKFYGGWECVDEAVGVIVTELWSGSLQAYRQLQCTIAPQLIKKLFDQIQTIHRAGYLHTDILSKNVLVNVNQGIVTDITLTDFGNSIEAYKIGPKYIHTFYDYHRDPANGVDQYFRHYGITLNDLYGSPQLLDYGLVWTLQACNNLTPSELRNEINNAISNYQRAAKTKVPLQRPPAPLPLPVFPTLEQEFQHRQAEERKRLIRTRERVPPSAPEPVVPEPEPVSEQEQSFEEQLRQFISRLGDPGLEQQAQKLVEKVQKRPEPELTPMQISTESSPTV